MTPGVVPLEEEARAYFDAAHAAASERAGIIAFLRRTAERIRLLEGDSLRAGAWREAADAIEDGGGR